MAGSTRAPRPSGAPPEEDRLFSAVDGRAPTRRGAVFVLSALAHALAAAAVVLVPLFLPDDFIETQRSDTIRLLLYDPPPPPPPPLPRGRPDAGRSRPAVPPRPAEPQPTPAASADRLEAPIEVARIPADALGLDDDRPGSPTGSEHGVPEGMEEGVVGGVVGGLPGGVLGGVIGGTGSGPVPVFDYDRPPRLLRSRRPRYPQEAFVKRIEGAVVVEFLIDETGRVVAARVVQSVPLLDAAALEAVREWVFSPAIKRGRPVATIARAPVTFRIY